MVKNSIVIQLQEEALNKELSLSNLLRKALLVAKKLDIQEMVVGVKNEMEGYTTSDNVPSYRVTYVMWCNKSSHKS